MKREEPIYHQLPDWISSELVAASKGLGAQAKGFLVPSAFRNVQTTAFELTASTDLQALNSQSAPETNRFS